MTQEVANRIPARIMQTARDCNLSLRQQAVRVNLTLLNPSCDYLFFDEAGVEELVSDHFPQYREVFDSFQFAIQKYDFFRYLAVFHHGGFYFDLDVLMAMPLSELPQCSCVFPFEGLTFSHLLRTHYGVDWQIGNYAFGATAGHPFLRAIIENCIKAQREPEWVTPMMRGMPRLSREEFYVMNSTGPGLISRTLAEYPELAASVTVLFPDDVCETALWNRFGDLGVHLMDGSWRPSKGLIHRRLAQMWEAWRMRKLIERSRRLGKGRAVRAKGNPPT